MSQEVVVHTLRPQVGTVYTWGNACVHATSPTPPPTPRHPTLNLPVRQLLHRGCHERHPSLRAVLCAVGSRPGHGPGRAGRDPVDDAISGRTHRGPPRSVCPSRYGGPCTCACTRSCSWSWSCSRSCARPCTDPCAANRTGTGAHPRPCPGGCISTRSPWTSSAAWTPFWGRHWPWCASPNPCCHLRPPSAAYWGPACPLARCAPAPAPTTPCGHWRHCCPAPSAPAPGPPCCRPGGCRRL